MIAYHYSSDMKNMIQNYFSFLNRSGSVFQTYEYNFGIPWLKPVDLNKYTIDKNWNRIESSIIILMLLFCINPSFI